MQCDNLVSSAQRPFDGLSCHPTPSLFCNTYLSSCHVSVVCNSCSTSSLTPPAPELNFTSAQAAPEKGVVAYGNMLNNTQVGAASAAMQMRAQRSASVQAAKSLKLSASEYFCKYLGGIVLIPTLFLGGIISVPPRTTLAVFRFGKLVSSNFYL